MPYLPISHKITTVSAARPEILAVRFIYNKFEPDEAINDMPLDDEGNPLQAFEMSEQAAAEFEKRKSFSQENARLVAVTLRSNTFLGNTPPEEIKALLADRDLEDIILKDIDLNYPNVMGTRIGDGEIIGRIAKLTKHLHAIKSGEVTDDPSKIRSTLESVFVDEAGNVDHDRIEAVDACFVSVDPIAPTHGDGHERVVRPHESMKTVNVLSELPAENRFVKSAAYSVDMKLSSRYFDDCLGYGANFCSTPLTQFVLTNYSDIKRLGKNSRRVSESFVGGSEDSLIVPLYFEKVRRHAAPEYVNAGLVLQKYEATEKGLQHIEDSIYEVTRDNTQFTVFDPKIKYGATYAYTSRELYLVTATVNADVPGMGPGVYKVKFLIEGSPSKTQFVSCFEKIAPRPPEAIFVKRGLGAEGIQLQWQFPVNPQQDIKKFQVFRRRNIQEPFYLLKQIDFNNADPVIPSPETVDRSLIEYADYPKTFFIDSTFTRDDKFIYSVCAIDAHGFSSTLSAQVEVSIDKTRNKLSLRTISPAGAPKQYPNMYVSYTDSENINQIRLTEDIIRTSGYDEVDVFFEPEARGVKKGSKTYNMYHLSKSPDPENEPKFVLQFINLDNGKTQNIDILIRDVRKDKSQPL